MSRAESTVVALFVGTACPASLFLLGWWSTAALIIYRVLPMPVGVSVGAAFAGLGLGVILDVLCLRKWTARFYTANLARMAVGYLFGSVVLVAVCMGLPLGNLIWGTLAGLYVGRRQHHAGANRDAFARAARRAGLFTALVTSLEALPIGILALRERIVVETLEAVAGLAPSVSAGPVGIGLVVAGCLALAAAQFWCTRVAATAAFRPGKRVGHPAHAEATDASL